MRHGARTVAAVLLALWCARGASGFAPQPSLNSVLGRAAQYVASFQQQLSGIVAEELYVQVARTKAGIVLRERNLKSDFLLVRPEGVDRYYGFRDVFEVDGRPVRDRQDRLTKLFLEPSGVSKQIQRIIDESARYNIGNVERNINTPTMALVFLDLSNQLRFEFSRARERTPAIGRAAGGSAPRPGVFSVAADVWVVAYRESSGNTIIHTSRGDDLPANGRFWIDPETGAVLMSELIAQLDDLHATIDVSYQSEPLLGFFVPVEMRERYDMRRELVEGRATYGRFRQFQVRVTEKIGRPERR